jgi:hypothetical protein
MKSAAPGPRSVPLSSALSRRKLLLGLAGATLIGGVTIYLATRFPPDTQPKGAYLRIAAAIARDRPRECFAYLEEEAQHAAFSIADYADKAAGRIREAYPEPPRQDTLAPYVGLEGCNDGADVWALLAEERGWLRRLRRDLSGVAAIEIVGERATVVTARGTRYPFRRRPNGIWGLTVFTAELQAEAERLARNWDAIQRAAKDYEGAGSR